MSGSIASHRFNNDLRYRSGEHENQRQLTPHYVLAPVWAALGGIGLDPCTEPDNPTDAERYYTVVDDGLTSPWCGPDWTPTVFVNPPYSKSKEPWIEQCIEAGARGQKVVLLIPAHTDTRIFQKAMQSASAVCFIKGRVKFGVLRENRRQEAASHPSALLGWNTDLASCSALGRVVVLRAQSGTPSTAEPVPVRPQMDKPAGRPEGEEPVETQAEAVEPYNGPTVREMLDRDPTLTRESAEAIEAMLRETYMRLNPPPWEVPDVR